MDLDRARNREIEQICSDFRTQGNSPLLMEYLDKICGPPDHKIFFAAIKAENSPVVSTLLEMKSDPNKPFSNGSKPLCLAIQCMDSSILKSVLKFKADPNERVENSHILMEMLYAMPNESYENGALKFEMMLQHGADVNMLSNINSPTVFCMGMAMLHEKDAVLQHMIKQAPNANVFYTKNITILEEVVNNVVKVKTLLSLGAEVSSIMFSNVKDHVVLKYLRLAKMMDQMHVPRHNIIAALPSLQFKSLESLALTTEYDVRLGLVYNDTPYVIENNFFFPIETNPIKMEEGEYAIAVETSLDTLFENDTSFAINNSFMDQ